MENPLQRTIVVSAVNLRKGGTLTILRDCLQYLSELSESGQYKIYALVHKRSLCDYPGIEYIEYPDTINGWSKRIKCEYIEMKKVSEELSPVYLWLSLHDTTPNVRAERRAVYCHTSFPFYKWNFRDIYFDYKIVLFSLFTRFVYQKNVHKNNYLIAQQQWFREGLSRMLKVDQSNIILCPPQKKTTVVVPDTIQSDVPVFLYASTPDCHKNFETLCRAAELLEKEIGENKFKVVITIDGSKNKYDSWLKKNWGEVKSIDFAGFMTKEQLFGYYCMASALVFPSRVESWGLPISEFMDYSKNPIIAADLPYAHETACGDNPVAFFKPTDQIQLKNLMKDIIDNDIHRFKIVDPRESLGPKAYSWAELFDILLK